MSTPDPVGFPSPPGQVRSHSRRRFWRWGIWFWVVLWIFSMLVEVGFKVKLKDRSVVMLGTGYGSLVVVLTAQDVYQIHPIEKPASSIWSQRNRLLHSKHPEFMFARLGGVMWKTSGDRQAVALPVSGFLWLWLLGGWVGCVRNGQRLDFRSKRTIAQAAALIFLPLVILQASRTMREVIAESEVSGCVMTLRNIQQAVRSHNGVKGINPGEKFDMPWDEIFGPKKFLPMEAMKCPGGQAYRLIKHPPRIGETAAECPNPEHHRRLKEIGTSGW